MVSSKDQTTPKELKLKELKPLLTAGNINAALQPPLNPRQIQEREELQSFRKEVEAFINDEKVLDKIRGIAISRLYEKDNFYNLKLFEAYRSHVADPSNKEVKEVFIQGFVEAFPKDIENIAKGYIKGKEKEQMGIIKKIGAKIKSSMSKTKLEMGSKAKAPTKTITGMQKRGSIRI